MEGDRDVVAQVIRLEQRLLAPETRSAAQQIEQLLDSELREIGASGRLWSRREIVSALVNESDPATILATDFVGTEIEPGIVHLTYNTCRDDKHARRSSLWRRSDDGWKIFFHQGTVVPSAGFEPATYPLGEGCSIP